MSLLHLFRNPGLTSSRTRQLVTRANGFLDSSLDGLRSESCYNIQCSEPLTAPEMETLTWLLSETFHPEGFGGESFLLAGGSVLEVGPRMNFTTAWSTNAVGICHACGLEKILRIERSRRFLLERARPLSEGETQAFLSLVHDRMTETQYPEPLESFETGMTPEPVFTIPLMEEGRSALERVNQELGLAFDEWDLDYYTELFVKRIGRNPTSVEAFDIAQSNSEHSRHWFFKGRLKINGHEIADHLIAIVTRPLDAHRSNSIIAFEDNSSTIRGFPIRTLMPEKVGGPSSLKETQEDYDILFTAETHNFPSGVAPFPGGGDRNRRPDS